MNFELSSEQQILRDMVRDFAAKEIEPVAADLDREGAFPSEILKKAASLGLMGVMVPPELGGSGMDFPAYALALTEISKACASTGVILSVHNSLACGALLKYATEETMKDWLPRAARGELLGAYLLTEPGAGSDAAAIRTRAQSCDEGWLLNGTKSFITSGAHADFGILYARTDPDAGGRGISAFLLDMNSAGVGRGAPEKKMGLHASATVEISLEDVVIPSTHLLGEENRGFGIALELLNAGRVGIAAQSLGIAEAALDEALRYSGEREQFGTSIGNFQSIQWHLTEMVMRVDAARLLLHRAAQAACDDRDTIRTAAVAKLFASQAAVFCAEKAVQIHGGYGYTKDYKVERLFRDARATEIYEGTSEVQRLVIARQLAVGT